MDEAERADVDKLIGRSLIFSESLASEVRSALRGAAKSLSVDEVLNAARRILETAEPLFAQALTDADIAAYVLGSDAVSKLLPPDVLATLGATTGPISNEELRALLSAGGPASIRLPLIERAAESLLERNIVTRDVFDQLGRDAKARAFTVARVMSEDTIDTIRNVLNETITEGASLGQFKSRLGPALEGSFIGPAHLENVYRTNIQTSFHEAHDELANNEIVSEVFPYQAYLPIHDGRTRDQHAELERLGLNGTNIYRRDDPFWDFFTPAWDYQ